MATPITDINLIIGDPTPVHVTVEDQDGNALPPAQLAFGALANVTIAADETGFNFSAQSGAVTGQVQATYSGPRSPTPVVSPELTVTVETPVTALQFVSP